MTAEEYTQQITQVKNKIDKLAEQLGTEKAELRKIKQRYIESNAKYIVDSKVRIIATGREGFISGIEINWNNKLKYLLNKVKKDGTMSKHTLGYSIDEDKIEKV